MYTPTGLSSSDKMPSVAVEVRYAQGEGSSASLDRDILLVGDANIDGYATDVTQINSEFDAANLFGERSEIHRMARQIFKVNKNVRVWAVGLWGGAGTESTGTITIAVNATAPGMVECWIAGVRLVQGYATDDTPTIIATALKNKINSIGYLPVTAENVDGLITLTAACKGTSGANVKVWTKVTPNTAVTSTVVAMSAGAGESNVELGLDKVSNKEYYYHVCARNDTTNVQALTAQLELLAEPSTQIRQVGLFGITETVATAAAITQHANVNSERVQCVQLKNAQTMPEELAAMVAGLRAKHEISDWGYNFNGLVVPAVGPQAKSDEPTISDLRTALESGISPLQVSKFGGVSLVASRSTRSLLGANADYRASQTYIVSVTDAWAKQLQSDLALSFTGKKVMGETLRELPGVVQPKHMRAKIIKWLEEFCVRPWLDASRLEDMIESVDVIKSTATLSAQAILYCAENLDKVWVIGLEASDPQ